MRKIQKWGNSLAVRIPAKWARRLMLQEGMVIEMCMENNCIVIRNGNQEEAIQNSNEILSFKELVGSAK